MNPLNSTLIEGTVEPEINFTEKTNSFPHSLDLTIRSARWTRRHGVDGYDHQTLLLPVSSSEPKAEVWHQYLKPGRQIRIVGHLRQRGSSIYLYAEHIEFKPQPADVK